jgi:galactosylceramidase
LEDGGFGDIIERMKRDPEFEKAVDVIGVHYPGTISPKSAINTAKPLWASEGFPLYTFFC